MSMPVIRLRQFVQFPANVYGDAGIAVTKANGNYTIETDWSGFGMTSAVPTSPTNYVLSYDTVSGVYVLVPSSLLGGGGGGGIVDAPSDGFSYGRLSAAWAKVAPLVSPALTGTPTAPTAAPATNTTQIATTAFVEAAISSSGGVTPSALTKTNDTNVTLTLGGTPATALLQATSIMVGWTGTLAATRGGFGADISGTSGVPLFATGAATFTATIGTGNFVRAIGPTFTGTPAAPTASVGTSTTQIATTAFVTAQAVAKTGDAITGPMTQSTGGSALSAFAAAYSLGFEGGGTRYGIVLRPAANSTNAMAFCNAAAATVGTIFTDATSTAYNTSSDVRLKEDLKSFDAGRIIDNTEVYDFAWKSTGKRSYGVSAQQANEVYPEAVTYTKEQDWYGIDYSKYVPVLLQELKSLRARVAELEAGIATKPATT